MEFGTEVLTSLLDQKLDWMTERCKILDNISKEMTNLQNSLRSIQVVLQDAENRKTREPIVYNWLRDLDDIFFDARNVRDDYMRYIEGSRSSMCNLNVLDDFKLAERTKDINERLEVVKNQSEMLALTPRESATNEIGETLHYGYSDLDFFVGRKQIRKSMLNEIEKSTDTRVKFIPIWGMGGIGKTTLAHYMSRQCSFINRKWLFVGKNGFDAKKIMNIIVGKSHTNVESLQEDLIETFNAYAGKYLIVLDDVRSLKRTEWDIFWRALQKVGQRGAGVVVIMTTRNKEVIEETGNRVPEQLAPLSNNDCWEIFKHCAFKYDARELRSKIPDYVLFKEIGRQIGEKLKGLPLAVKMVGSSLRNYPELENWRSFLHNQEWTNDDAIMQALKWSSDLLPLYLKPCFAFCSIFPKEHVFNVDELIQMWMAHDFIIVSEGRPEDIGRTYFEEMLKLSLFQCINDNYVMHDMIHDLARLISNDHRIRHLSNDNLDYNLKLLHEKRLLSFIAANSEYSISIPPTIIDKELFNKLEFVRVLVLRVAEISEIPDSISKLRYVRYIDFLGCSGLKRLPESLCEELHFLQTLKVPRYCSLPKNLGNLIHLRHLDGEPSVNSGIGKLTSLQELTAVKIDVGENIGELLRNLMKLRGKLRITGLKNIRRSQDAENFFMPGKIDELELDFCNNSDSAPSSTLEETILDALKPYKYLRLLKISNYVGSRSPNWMNAQHLQNLTTLYLSHNDHWELLPPLGKLPLLENLSLEHMHGLKKLGREFYAGEFMYRPSVPWRDRVMLFRSLTSLRLENCNRLEEWVEMESSSSLIVFSALKELIVSRCPLLRMMPSFKSIMRLRRMKICDCHGLTTLDMSNICCIEHLSIQNCCNLKQVSFNSGEGLCLSSCESLEIVFIGDASWGLKKIEVSNCQCLRRIRTPPGTELRVLTTDNMEILSALLRQKLTYLEHLDIHNCSELAYFSTEVEENWENVRYLQSLDIRHCYDLVSLPPVLKNFSFLVSLEIDDCPELKFLPTLPRSLQYLGIEGCPVLEERYPKKSEQEWSQNRLDIIDRLRDTQTIFLDKPNSDLLRMRELRSTIRAEKYSRRPVRIPRPSSFLDDIKARGKQAMRYMYATLASDSQELEDATVTKHGSESDSSVQKRTLESSGSGKKTAEDQKNEESDSEELEDIFQEHSPESPAGERSADD